MSVDLQNNRYRAARQIEGLSPDLQTASLSRRNTLVSEAQELPLLRRIRDLRLLVEALGRKRLTKSPLQLCSSIIRGRYERPEIQKFFAGLPAEERHYWIASLYACLIPITKRRKLAAYFTPPHLAKYAIEKLRSAGITPGVDKILDPASGGAAFLVPLAECIIREGRKRGETPARLLKAVNTTLSGIEIEPDLAELSHSLLKDLTRTLLPKSDSSSLVPVVRADALRLAVPQTLFDAVIGNPPYGRVYRPTDAVLRRFEPVISNGYVNLYSVFIQLALEWVKPGGIVCLIVPMSFLGGSNFRALRKHILNGAHILSLDQIARRNDVFLDVLYDVGVLTLRKKGSTTVPTRATSSLLLVDAPPQLLGELDLPKGQSERVWALPDGVESDELFQRGLETLEDYGYVAKAGYFVWNREGERYRTGRKPRSNEVPLYWAHNARPNIRCKPLDGGDISQRFGFVKIAGESSAIVHTDAILLQRTSNRKQERRLVAGLICQKDVPGSRGFVSENHTILVLPSPDKKQTVSLTVLCRLLNTAAADSRFRRISGTVSVSTKALRILPLPAAASVSEAFKFSTSDDQAADRAYLQSSASKVLAKRRG